MRGLVSFTGSNSNIQCLVRDISEGGARLMFDRPDLIAESLKLHLPIRGQTFRANVRWRKGDEMGVAFVADAPWATFIQDMKNSLAEIGVASETKAPWTM
jgi:hypothetical protein